MPIATELKERFSFQQRDLDANGDRLGAWDEAGAFDRPTGLIFLRGGETVQQQRLAGRQPVILTVYAETATRAIGAAWRAVNVRNGKSYEVTSAAPARDLAFIDILAVEIKGDDD